MPGLKLAFYAPTRTLGSLLGIFCLVTYSLLLNGSISFVVHDQIHTIPDVSAFKFATSDVQGPRSLVVDPDSGDVLVLARGMDQVVLLRVDATGNSSERFTLVDAAGLGLNHGLAINNGYLYASRDTTVYRWPYTSGSTTQITAPYEVVVKNLNENGQGGAPLGHTTRTLAFDNSSRLYVSVGSASNVDENSNRSRIRRFDLSLGIPPGGFEFTDPSSLFADGLRNEVGLAFDRFGRLWGVENSADNLDRADLGTDIYQNNPAEELNLFDGPVGTFYGYPRCFSSFNLTGYPPNTQFAWPSPAVWPTTTNWSDYDGWCRDRSNNRPPELPMPAHNAPLGIAFYMGEGCTKPGAFPCSFAGDAFVAMHGSWNRRVPDGFQVVHIPMDKTTGLPLGTRITVASYRDFATRCVSNSGCWRPVNVAFLKDGRILVSSDSTNEVTLLEHNGSDPAGDGSDPAGALPPQSAPTGSSPNSPQPPPQPPPQPLPAPGSHSPGLRPSILLLLLLVVMTMLRL